MHQDANLNVMALTAGASPGCPVPNWGGAGAPPIGNDPAAPATGQVVEQYVYEPYGALKTVDTFFAYGVNRVGHQGLFYERFNGDYTEQTLAQFAEGLYYNRNRWYSPTLGRFVSRDPNESALPIMAALAMNGDSVILAFGGFDAQGMYGDGMGLYQYVRGNPIRYCDSLGMSVDEELVGRNPGATIVMGAMALALSLPIILQYYAAVEMTIAGAASWQSGAIAFGDALMTDATALSLVMLSAQISAVKAIEAHFPTLAAHMTKISTGGPNDRDNNKWTREVLGYLAKMETHLKRMPNGKTYRVYRLIVDSV